MSCSHHSPTCIIFASATLGVHHVWSIAYEKLKGQNQPLFQTVCYIPIFLKCPISAQYLPFIIVFGSVILLFLGLCIYVICVCPSFMRDLQIETKNNDSDSDDEESQTCTTELTSGVSARHSSGNVSSCISSSI